MKCEHFILNEERKVTLDSCIYEPSKEMPKFDRRPAMLVLPGGAYCMCSDREAEPVAAAYLAAGFNTFILRYSVGDASAWPNPLDDACAAIDFIRQNAEKFNVNPEKVAAVGFSAGGHLTAVLSNTEGHRPDAAILCYPCTNIKIAEILINKPMFDVGDLVTENTSPTFIFATCGDNLVPIENSVKYATRLCDAGVPFEMHVFERGVHGLSVSTPHVLDNKLSEENAIASQWVKMSVDWLNNRFGIGKDE